MSNTTTQLPIIGRAEKAAFPELKVTSVPVKIDTGADSSSIWAHVTERDGTHLKVVFFGPSSSFYSGEAHLFSEDEFEVTRVANSFGHKELRYKVKLSIKIKGRTIRGTFTLSDRSNKLYPVLIGRALLTKKFLVDVSKGSPLREEENSRRELLNNELAELEEV